MPDAAAAATNLPVLPSWDLSDLYPAPDSPELAAALDRAQADVQAFAAAHAGRLPAMSGAELAGAIASYEKIEEVLGRVMSYAQLLFSGDSTDPAIGKFYQSMNERVTEISTALIFFTLELNRLDEADLEAKLADPALARWAPWLRDVRVFRPHQLSDEVESAAARARGHRPRRLVAPVRRDRRRHARRPSAANSSPSAPR